MKRHILRLVHMRGKTEQTRTLALPSEGVRERGMRASDTLGTHFRKEGDRLAYICFDDTAQQNASSAHCATKAAPSKAAPAPPA